MGFWFHSLPLPDSLEQSLGAGLHCSQTDAGTTRWRVGSEVVEMDTMGGTELYQSQYNVQNVVSV